MSGRLAGNLTFTTGKVMSDKKGKVKLGTLQVIPPFDPERAMIRQRDNLAKRVRHAYDPEGKRLKFLRPEERQGGVDFWNTPGETIGINDVPEGAGKEEILKAIRERRQSRQRWRDAQPDNTTELGTNRTYRRDI